MRHDRDRSDMGSARAGLAREWDDRRAARPSHGNEAASAGARLRATRRPLGRCVFSLAERGDVRAWVGHAAHASARPGRTQARARRPQPRRRRHPSRDASAAARQSRAGRHLDEGGRSGKSAPCEKGGRSSNRQPSVLGLTTCVPSKASTSSTASSASTSCSSFRASSAPTRSSTLPPASIRRSVAPAAAAGQRNLPRSQRPRGPLSEARGHRPSPGRGLRALARRPLPHARIHRPARRDRLRLLRAALRACRHHYAVRPARRARRPRRDGHAYELPPGPAPHAACATPARAPRGIRRADDAPSSSSPR